jgi:hypothetical protein
VGSSMFSLAGTIDYIAPRLQGALVAPEALTAVRALAESIPASLTSWIDFECRLREGRPQVDLSVRIDRRARDRFARYSRERAAASGGAAWHRAAALGQAWADPATSTSVAVGGLWLEFDLAAGIDPATAPPRLFIDFVRQAPAPADRLDILADALAPITGSPRPEWLRAGIHRCVHALPAAAGIVYVGLPADDRVTAVRLCVIGMDEADAAGYLETVGWPGDVAVLDRRPGSGRARGGIVHLDLDDRGGIGSRIGLEYPLRRRPQVKGVVADTALLDHLVASGACAAAKREAMLAWPGCELGVLPHEIWPSLVMRRVSHVKFVCDRDEPFEAKAYLCVAHEWRQELARSVPPLFEPPPIAS